MTKSKAKLLSPPTRYLLNNSNALYYLLFDYLVIDVKNHNLRHFNFQAFQISNLIREYIEVLQKYGSSDDNASRNLQSIYGPGIAALYQHQPPPRHANQDDMYMMHTTSGPVMPMNTINTPYQITRPSPMFQKSPQPIVEDISV